MIIYLVTDVNVSIILHQYLHYCCISSGGSPVEWCPAILGIEYAQSLCHQTSISILCPQHLREL